MNLKAKSVLPLFVFAIAAAVILLISITNELSSSPEVLSQYQYLRSQSPEDRRHNRPENYNEYTNNNAISPHIPSTLDLQSQRQLSLNLGGGNCKWQPPSYDVPTDIDFYKTIIAGFPSGDKRMIFMQMEALTGWPAKDEWDFEHLGMSNHPFIKANYPHHEGIWGWGNVADQVVMMVRNIRRSMVEYHDILW
jgi:hypothetical protein